MSLPSFVSGGGEKSSSAASRFTNNLKSGESMTFVCLTGVMPPDGEDKTGKNCMISFNEYSLFDDGKSFHFPKLDETSLEGNPDPGLVLNWDCRERSFLLVRPVGETEDKIYSFTTSVARQLVDLEVARGESLKGQVLKVMRTGENLKTRYKVIPLGKAVEIEGESVLDLADLFTIRTYDQVMEYLDKNEISMPKESKKAGKSSKKDASEFDYADDDK